MGSALIGSQGVRRVGRYTSMCGEREGEKIYAVEYVSTSQPKITQDSRERNREIALLLSLERLRVSLCRRESVESRLSTVGTLFPCTL